MAEWNTDLEVAQMEKNEVESIRVQLKSYDGEQFADFRIWYVDEDGEYHPSRKGFSIPAAKVERFADAIEALRRHVQRRPGHA